MVALKSYLPDNFGKINYTLSETQLQFTASPEAALAKIKERNDGLKNPICIYEDEEIAGFFVLDTSDDKKELTENSHSILLRSLSLNPAFQGKGIAKEAMLLIPEFVKIHFPSCNEIVLAVNFQNPVAYQLYLKTNFIDQGKTMIGRNGLQYILTLKI